MDSTASSQKKRSIWPWAIGIGVAIAILLLWEKWAKASTKGTGGAPVLNNGGGGDYVPPPLTGAEQYDYQIQGNAADSTPLSLAKAWGQEQTQATLDALIAANPDKLHKAWQATVIFVPEGTGTGVASTRQTRWLDNAGSINAQVFSTTPAGASFPNAPQQNPDGSNVLGQWSQVGASAPGVQPWNVRQVIHIPASWGPPPTRELDQFAAKVV